MNEPHKTFLTILMGVAGLSITAWYKSCLAGADVVLSIAFVVILWFAFGLPWAHKHWNRPEAVLWHRVAPRLCWAVTIVTMTIPAVSLLAGAILTKYTPRRLDAGMASVMCSTPPRIAATPLARSASPAVSNCVKAGTASYVVAGSSTAMSITPAAPVLAIVLEEIDTDLRVRPVSILALALLFAIFFLWIIEIASDWNPIRQGVNGPAAPAG